MPRSLVLGAEAGRPGAPVPVAYGDNLLAAPEWTLPAHHVAALVVACLAALFASAMFT